MVVITEIMYNPPESGADSLEFIELGNPSQLYDRSLSEFYFSEGVAFTFPAGYTLDAGSYVVIAKDSVAFENAFGVTAFEWDNSSLLNTGEPLVLKTSTGLLVDSVYYGTSSPWPTSSNGDGTSLVFCNDTLDNSDPNNWTEATTNAGFSVAGVTVLANPNAGCDGLTGIGLQETKDILVYPNPNSGRFTINNAGLRECTVSIFRLNGGLAYQQTWDSADDKMEIDLQLNAGIYLLQLAGSSTVMNQRLVILR